jgi:DNA-binding transcriptional MocR family regulator
VSDAEQYQVEGRSAAAIVASCEAAVRDGRLAAGERLPTVRALARATGASPATVASAYRTLQDRGVVVAEGRRGTRVAPQPPVAPIAPAAPALALPPGTRDLRRGQPHRAFVPDLRPVLARTPSPETLPGRGIGHKVDRLLELAADEFARDGIDAANLAVVGGALDGVESVLQAHLARGDRVAVEDPTYPPFLDLLRALGARPVPVRIDAEGLRPEAVERALASGVRALIVTPRAQNPTGAAITAARGAQLREIVAGRDVLIVEDDHAGPVAGTDVQTLTGDGMASQWAVIRSVSKSLGPDLRLAVAAGDAATIARVEGRQALGRGWISTILQHAVAALWTDPGTIDLLARARSAYADRRRALVDALAVHGIDVAAPSGLNVWAPVREESATVEALLASGWAVAAGERFRLGSPPAIRITIADLPVELGADLAAAIATTCELTSTAGGY